MFTGIEPNQLILFIILLAAVVLLFTEWIRIDLTAILIILAILWLLGVRVNVIAWQPFVDLGRGWCRNC